MTAIATLFSGGEGVGVGARMAGIKHLWGVEYDDAIAAVARMNGFHTITADVCAVDYAPLPAPDILHASPPCPNFSVAKTNRGETELDLALSDAVCRAIRALRPRVFTLENVRGYASGYWPDSTPEEIEDRPKSLGMILDALTQCGYEYDLMIINSANYGVPQTRERLYVIAMHGKRPPRLMPTHSKHGDMFTRRWIGWYEAIADLLDTLPPAQFAPWQLARLPAELRESVMMMSNVSGYERASIGHNPCPIDAPANTVVAEPTGGMPRAFIVDGKANAHGASVTIADEDAPAFTVTSSSDRQAARAFLVEGRNPNGGSDVYGDMPAQTVSTSHPPRAAVHGRVVAMTPRALARFQSFPDDYILPEKKSLACRVIGNAVPPRLYAAIIGAVLEQV